MTSLEYYIITLAPIIALIDTIISVYAHRYNELFRNEQIQLISDVRRSVEWNSSRLSSGSGDKGKDDDDDDDKGEPNEGDNEEKEEKYVI